MLGLWELDRSLPALLPLLHRLGDWQVVMPLSAAAAPPIMMLLPSRAATVSVTKTWAGGDAHKNYRHDTLADGGTHRPQPLAVKFHMYIYLRPSFGSLELSRDSAAAASRCPTPAIPAFH